MAKQIPRRHRMFGEIARPYPALAPP